MYETFNIFVELRKRLFNKSPTFKKGTTNYCMCVSTAVF